MIVLKLIFVEMCFLYNLICIKIFIAKYCFDVYFIYKIVQVDN